MKYNNLFYGYMFFFCFSQSDECQLSNVEDDFMNPEEVAKESEVNRR